MKILNFFEPLNDDNQLAQPLLNKIVNLFKDSEGNSIVTEPNLRINNNDLQKHLNPKTYTNPSESIFPLLNVLMSHSRTCSVTDTWDNFLSALFNNSRHDNAINDIYQMTITSKNRRNDYNVFTTRSRDTPNKSFETFLNLLDNTHDFYSNFHLDSEVHASILNDGFVCWVDDVFQTKSTFYEGKSSFGLIQSAKYCSDIIKHVLNIKNGQLESSSSSQEFLWSELLSCDSAPHFSHLDYWRPTTQLLLMEDAILQSYLDKIASIRICNYIKLNSLPSTQEGDLEFNVFSNFSTPFFEKFKKITKDGVSETLNESNIIKLDNLPPASFHLTPLVINEYNYQYNSMFSNNRNLTSSSYTPTGNNRTFLPIGGSIGFVFPQVSIKESSSLSSTLIKTAIQRNPNSRVFGIVFNGFTKATSKQDYEFVSFTKNQAISRKGFFLPVYLPIKTLNHSLEEENSYIFNLLNCSDSLDQMRKRARSRGALKDFCSKYSSDGMLFVDYEIYIQEQKELMKNLVEFSAINSDSYARFNSNEIGTLLSSLQSIKTSLSSVIGENTADFSDAITSKLNINSVIERKYNKVNSHYTRVRDQNLISKNSLRENSHDIRSQILNIKNNENQIKELVKRVEDQRQASLKLYSTMRTNIQNRVDSVKTLIKNKSLHQSLSKRYQQAVNEAISKRKYLKTNFFNNLFENEAIKILQIDFCDTSNDKYSSINSLSSDSLKNEFYKKFIENSETMNIREVVFIIDKPVAIKVDAGAKGEIAGGPYIIKVSQSRLNIALAYPSSIHGHNDRYVFVHPHSSSINSSSFINSFSRNSELFSWDANEERYYFNYTFSNACLGEASSLIYKAFESRDLKSIIIASLTWVKNANSVDAWGKNYKFFPRYQDMLDQQSSTPIEDLPNVTEDEVEDFINEMLEVEENNFQNQESASENTPQEIPTLERAEPRSIEMFNTQDEYVPYTPR